MPFCELCLINLYCLVCNYVLFQLLLRIGQEFLVVPMEGEVHLELFAKNVTRRIAIISKIENSSKIVELKTENRN